MPNLPTHDHEDTEAARHENCPGCVAASRGQAHEFVGGNRYTGSHPLLRKPEWRRRAEEGNLRAKDTTNG